MLKSCSFCGRVHGFDEECPKRVEYRQAQIKTKEYHYERDSKEDKFRNTVRWKHKRQQIRERDLNMCRYCFLVKKRIVTEGLSVHHIVPLKENARQKLSDSNLITLCRMCHERAEDGSISAEKLRSLVAEKLKI